MSSKNAICQIIDALIAEAPEASKGAIEGQVATLQGRVMAGSIRRHHTVEGVYVVTTVGQRPGARPNSPPEPMVVEAYLLGNNFCEFHQAAAKEESRVLLPNGGGGRIIPGVTT